jgi:hypothetical protein
LWHACSWAFFYIFGHLRDFFRAQVQKLRSSKVRIRGVTSPAVCRSALLSLLVQQNLCFNRCLPQAPEYAPIRQDYEDFYTRRMYYRLHVRAATLHYNPLHTSSANASIRIYTVVLTHQDCFNRPISSAPDAHVDVLLRQPPQGQK